MNNITAIYLLDTLVGTLDTDGSNDYDDALHMAIDALQHPERKKGKWEKGGEQPYFRKHFDIVVCSICNKRGEHRWNFCPNCGADMRGEDA